MDDTTKLMIRTLVRGTYDLQKQRISTGNRVVGNFRAKLGQAPGERAVDSLDTETLAMLDDLKHRFRRIADAMPARVARGPFPGDEVISTWTEFALVQSYIDLDAVEQQHFKRMERALADAPVSEWLLSVRGIGPAMAGVIISEFDIHKARYPSSLWAYAGLDVAHDGMGRSRRKDHLVKRNYTNAKGDAAERDSITFNPWLKTKLLGVLASSFLRAASPYAEHYRNYRHRLETDPRRTVTDKPGFHQDDTWTKQRRHQAACRYMVKMFLIDLYKHWRALEGLPVAPSYHEAKMGHKHAA